MISRLRGKPVARRPDGVVLDVNGVGYLLAVTPSAFRLAHGDGEVSLETYLHVREDALVLYINYFERDWLRKFASALLGFANCDGFAFGGLERSDLGSNFCLLFAEGFEFVAHSASSGPNEVAYTRSAPPGICGFVSRKVVLSSRL